MQQAHAITSSSSGVDEHVSVASRSSGRLSSYAGGSGAPDAFPGSVTSALSEALAAHADETENMFTQLQSSSRFVPVPEVESSKVLVNGCLDVWRASDMRWCRHS